MGSSVSGSSQKQSLVSGPTAIASSWLPAQQVSRYLKLRSHTAALRAHLLWTDRCMEIEVPKLRQEFSGPCKLRRGLACLA